MDMMMVLKFLLFFFISGISYFATHVFLNKGENVRRSATGALIAGTVAGLITTLIEQLYLLMN